MLQNKFGLIWFEESRKLVTYLLFEEVSDILVIWRAQTHWLISIWSPQLLTFLIVPYLCMWPLRSLRHSTFLSQYTDLNLCKKYYDDPTIHGGGWGVLWGVHENRSTSNHQQDPIATCLLITSGWLYNVFSYTTTSNPPPPCVFHRITLCRYKTPCFTVHQRITMADEVRLLSYC